MRWVKLLLWGLGYSVAIMFLLEMILMAANSFNPLSQTVSNITNIISALIGFTLAYFTHASKSYAQYKIARMKNENKSKPTESTPDQF